MSRVWMLGVGGMGMLPLALYARGMGYEIFGYDDALSSDARQILTKNGVHIVDENFNFSGELVVRSSAIHADHLLYRRAQAAGLPIIRRGEFLAQLLQDKKLLAVVGSHGKTTTTAWLVHMWQILGIDFGYLVGGTLRDGTAPGHYSATAEWVISEIDESDGTIEHFSPEATLLINYDWDHADKYTDENQLKNVFLKLFERTRGRIFLPASDPLVASVQLSEKYTTFDFGNGDIAATLREFADARSEIETPFGAHTIPWSGDFNAINALAALSATYVILKQAPAHLEHFSGVKRRQDVLFQSPKWTVIADYAHHPREISAFLKFAKKRFPGPHTVIFQPHRYTRTRQFAAAFAETLSGDAVYLLPVYAASECALPDGNTEAIAQRMHGAQLVSKEVLNEHLLPEAATSRTWFFVGAGDIERVAHHFVRQLKQRIAGQLGPNVRIDEPLAEKTTAGIGGHAAFYAEPDTQEKLHALLQRAHALNIKIFMLGRGANLLISDVGFDGLVVRLVGAHWNEIRPIDAQRVYAGAGVRLKQFAQWACASTYTGFEFLDGIPGTIGGALAMNAGAMGASIFDHVVDVHMVTLNGESKVLTRNDMHPIYRACPELKNACVVGATFSTLHRAPGHDIRAKMASYAQKRQTTQPKDPSFGCTFKNPELGSAGRLIDACGLKNFRIGGAAISELHANFIVNSEHTASAHDVLRLIRLVRQRVWANHNIELSTEVVYLNRNGIETI